MVASTKNLSAETIDSLISDSEESVRTQLAANKKLTGEQLEKLSKDSDLVRTSVASNGSSPSALLSRLAADPWPEVRRAVAGNINCPADVLSRLSADDEVWIAAPVAQ
jgi:hypothetical protein